MAAARAADLPCEGPNRQRRIRPVSTVGRRETQAAGIVTLTMAVLSILVMSALVAPPRPGVAIRTAIPEPPEIGSCGNLYGWEFVIMNCAQTHTVEVAYTWTAAAPAAGPQPTFGLCADKVPRLRRVPAAQTRMHTSRGAGPVLCGTGRSSPPAPTATTSGTGRGRLAWSRRSVRPHLRATRDRSDSCLPTARAPPTLRSCYVDPGTALTVVPCTSPHIGESLRRNYYQPQQPSDLGRARLRLRVGDVVRRSATFGHRLRRPHLPRPTRDHRSVRPSNQAALRRRCRRLLRRPGLELADLLAREHQRPPPGQLGSRNRQRCTALRMTPRPASQQCLGERRTPDRHFGTRIGLRCCRLRTESRYRYRGSSLIPTPTARRNGGGRRRQSPPLRCRLRFTEADPAGSDFSRNLRPGGGPCRGFRDAC